MQKTAKRLGTSNLEATGSTPVGRANNTAETLRFPALRSDGDKCPVGTTRQHAAQSGTKLAQNRAQSVPEPFFSDQQTIPADLTRAKIAFQLSAIIAAMGRV